MLRFSGTGTTHVGLVRADNEDSAFVGPDLVLVADGVGGGAAGEVASATTAYVVVATVLAERGRDTDPGMLLRRAVLRAQEQVARGVALDPRREGMATTLTAIAASGGRFALVHLGDYRGFVWRDDELVQVSRDHTWVAQAVDRGALTESAARQHPWRNVVTRTVNGRTSERADVLPLALRPGDRVLLASDGLTDLVPEREIERLMHRYDDDTAAQALTDAALTRGGHDNVTVVVGRFAATA